MSDDLVKRLRVVAHKTTEQNATLAAGLGVSSTTQSREYIECILDEAADRIEELEAKLAEAKGWIEYHRDGRGINHNSFLFTAEIDRLLGEKQ